MNIDKIGLQHYNGCVMFQNEKILLITTRKIAHSRCIQIFGNELISDGTKNFSFSVNNSDLTLAPLNLQEESEYFNKINNTWNNFLQKKEKRDLVILYRDPLEQFISAFMQDFMSKMPHNSYYCINNALLYYFLENISASPLEKSNFLKKYQENGLSEEMFYSFNKIFVEFIKMFFEFFITSATYTDSHYSPWLTFVSHLYYSNKIDKNKIKFIDIYENPLEESLKNYFDEPIEKVPTYNYKYKRHNFLFDYMKNLIMNNKKYTNVTSSILSNEILFYNRIKNNEL